MYCLRVAVFEGRCSKIAVIETPSTTDGTFVADTYHVKDDVCTFRENARKGRLSYLCEGYAKVCEGLLRWDVIGARRGQREGQF